MKAIETAVPVDCWTSDIGTSRTRIVLVTAAVCTVMCASCDFGSRSRESRWAQFESGGFFATAAPSLSADGKSLVYASACTGRGDIYIRREPFSSSTRLTDDSDCEFSPLFTPDGTRIVFAREKDTSCHLWIMDADGTHMRELTNGNGRDEPQSLSSNGRYLLYSRSTGGMMHAVLMTMDGVSEENIDVGELAVISPDSTFAIYSDAGNLWRLNLAGPRPTRVRLSGTGWPMDTSDDGRIVLVARRTDPKVWTGDDELWVADTESGTEKLVGTGHSGILFGSDRRSVF